MTPLFRRGLVPSRYAACLVVGWFAAATLCANAAEPSIRSMRVQGNRVFSERVILSWIDSKPGRELDAARLSRDLSAILDHYRSAGYWLASAQTVRTDEQGGTAIQLKIVEGPRCLVQGVQITGNAALDSTQILALMDTQPGQVLVQRTFEADLDEILRWYENHGYPFCAIRVADLSVDGDGEISVTLAMDEGPEAHLDAIDVVGNKVTREEVILRELRIETGQRYDQRLVDAGYRWLSRLDFLAEVSRPEVRYDLHRQRGVLQVTVREGKPNHISGAVGYVPKTGMARGYFTGLFELALRNLWGTGRRLDAAWRRRNPDASELSLGYQEPWVLGLPLGVGVTYQHRQRLRYAVTELQTVIKAPLSHNLTAQGGLGWERSVPDSVGGLSMPRSQTISATFEVSYDTRDNPANPHSGLHYRTSARLGYKRNYATQGFSPDKEKAKRVSYAIGLEHFWSVRKRQVAAWAVHAAQVTSDEMVVPASEKLSLGGASTLRGYREEHFTGVQIAWMNLEYRYLVSRASRLFGFLDAGYYHDKEDRRKEARGIESTSAGKIGYGMGLRAESRMGTLGIDYGLARGEDVSEGKIHVSIVNRF